MTAIDKNNFKKQVKLFKYEKLLNEVYGQAQFFHAVKPLKQKRYSVFDVYSDMIKRKCACQKNEKKMKLKEIFICKNLT